MSLLLQRLEIEPPNLGYHDLRRHGESDLTYFERLGLLQPTTPAGSLDCWECGSSHYCPITFLTNEQTGSRVGYIHCPECGVQRVDLRRTKRWSIDVLSLLQTTFGNLVAGNVAITIVTERLWRVGRISLAAGLQLLTCRGRVHCSGGERSILRRSVRIARCVQQTCRSRGSPRMPNRFRACCRTEKLHWYRLRFSKTWPVLQYGAGLFMMRESASAGTRPPFCPSRRGKTQSPCLNHCSSERKERMSW